MAQGITTDKAITVMSSRERYLSNQRMFNVGVTRVRDELTMIVDNKVKLARLLDHNPGNKTSSLETMGRLDIEGKAPVAPREPFNPGPVDGVTLPEGADSSGLLPDLPPLPDGHAMGAAPAKDLGRMPDKLDGAEILPPLPERSLGLDL
jgi:hypothetical protein